SAALLGLALALAAAPAAPDRSHPPSPGPPRPLALPEVHRLTLSNGLAVRVLERHELPTAELMVVVRTGAASAPVTKAGLAALTAALLDEGAGGRDALALADALESLGADLEATASWDSSIVALHVPSARLEPALALLADLALRPAFPPAELERIR